MLAKRCLFIIIYCLSHFLTATNYTIQQILLILFSDIATLGVEKDPFSAAGYFDLEETVVDDIYIVVDGRNDDFAVGIDDTTVTTDVKAEEARLGEFVGLVFI